VVNGGNAGAKVPYKVVERRAGDTVAVWAATELAESLLGWKSKLDLADMCRDQWRWAQKYPQVRFVGGILRCIWHCECAFWSYR
jgi:UDP-glucose 4-epimerase